MGDLEAHRRDLNQNWVEEFLHVDQLGKEEVMKAEFFQAEKAQERERDSGCTQGPLLVLKLFQCNWMCICVTFCTAAKALEVSVYFYVLPLLKNKSSLFYFHNNFLHAIIQLVDNWYFISVVD